MNDRLSPSTALLAALVSAMILVVTGAVIGGIVWGIVAHFHPSRTGLGLGVATLVNFVANLFATIIAWLLSRRLKSNAASLARLSFLYLVGYTTILLILTAVQEVATRSTMVVGSALHVPIQVPILIFSIVIPTIVVAAVLGMARTTKSS